MLSKEITVALGFSLLDDDSIWRVTKTINGTWVDRQYVEAAVESIDKISAIWEPFVQGQTEIILPAGVSSTDAVMIFSEVDMKVSNDLAGNLSDGQLIYLEDPAVIITTPLYKLVERANWKKNTAFILLNSHFEYLGVRVEKK